MSRRVLIGLAALALLAAAPAGASSPPPPSSTTPTTTTPGPKTARSWADAQIRLVVAHGLMAPDVASFRPDDPLTRGALSALVAGLTERLPAQVVNPSAPLRHRDHGSTARPPLQPPGSRRRTRAPASGHRYPCGSGLLGGARASLPRRRDPRSGGRGGDVHAPDAHRLAAENPHDGVLVRRLSVRVGRHERAR